VRRGPGLGRRNVVRLPKAIQPRQRSDPLPAKLVMAREPPRRRTRGGQLIRVRRLPAHRWQLQRLGQAERDARREALLRTQFPKPADPVLRVVVRELRNGVEAGALRL